MLKNKRMRHDLAPLIAYAGWQRQYWLDYFGRHEPDILNTSAGPGGDGRLATIRDVVKHIFSAQVRYIDRLTDKPLTDPRTIPTETLESLFAFGDKSRETFLNYLDTCPDNIADVPIELRLGNDSMHASPRKIVTHVVLHEIRHWAQIATILRFNGHKSDLQDFIFSPAMP